MKKRYIILLHFLLISKAFLFSQSDFQPDPCAQQVDSLALAIAASENMFHPDALLYLKEWETICTYSEPTERLRLLMSIAGGVYATEPHRDYLDEGIRRFTSRLREAEMADAKEFYQDNQAWFCYLPLNHPFDVFTKEIAENLLPKLKPGTGEYLICVLLSGQLDKFEALRTSKAYRYTPYHTVLKEKKPVVAIVDRQSAFVGRTGIWLPGAETSKYQSLGWYGCVGVFAKISERVIFEANAELIFNEKRDTIVVNGPLGRSGGYSSGQVHVGIGFARRYVFSNRNFLELQSGIGGAWLSTDIEKYDPELAEDTARTIVLGALHIPLGVSYTFGSKRGHAVGLGAKYHLRPFAMDRRLLTPLSMGSTTLALQFYF